MSDGVSKIDGKVIERAFIAVIEKERDAHKEATGKMHVALDRVIVQRNQHIAELERQLQREGQRRDNTDAAYHKRGDRIVKLENQLSASPCGVKDHCMKDLVERRKGERRDDDETNWTPTAIGKDRRSYEREDDPHALIWKQRRITNLGPPCARCGEVAKARKAMWDQCIEEFDPILKLHVAKAVSEALEAAVDLLPQFFNCACRTDIPRPNCKMCRCIAAIRGKEVKR
jgi:hypothetical protein